MREMSRRDEGHHTKSAALLSPPRERGRGVRGERRENIQFRMEDQIAQLDLINSKARGQSPRRGRFHPPYSLHRIPKSALRIPLPPLRARFSISTRPNRGNFSRLQILERIARIRREIAWYFAHEVCSFDENSAPADRIFSSARLPKTLTAMVMATVMPCATTTPYQDLAPEGLRCVATDARWRHGRGGYASRISQQLAGFGPEPLPDFARQHTGQA
jgi:hypothetical protein